MLPFFLLDPDIQARVREAQREQQQAQREYFETVLAPNARGWKPGIEKPKEDVCYSAESFMHQIHYPFDLNRCPPSQPGEGVVDTDEVCDFAPQENSEYPVQWVYRNRVLPRGEGLDAYPLKGRAAPKIYFDADVPIPVLLQHRAWSSDPKFRMRVWMSATPMEFFTLRPAVRKARRKTLIAGLGLGVILRMVAQKRNVQHIVVVEHSQALLDWFGYDLVSDVEDETNTRIEVVCADVYEHLNEVGAKNYSGMIFDIWDSWSGARWDKEFRKVWEQHRSKLWYWGARVLHDPRY